MHFPLTTAYHCQDCNQVGDCAEYCACCGSSSIWGLAGVLEREDRKPVLAETKAILGMLEEVEREIRA